MITKNTKEKVRPFIIWTLQRTGGTNLASNLFNLTDFPSVQHEPFNKGRVFGDITDKWLENGNREDLMNSIDNICRQGICMKHCAEVVPIELSYALVEFSVANNYEHIFLYRNNRLNRLLSLHYARSTGEWGPSIKSKSLDEKNILIQQYIEQQNKHVLPVEELTAHENRSIQILTDIWKRLESAGVEPVKLDFEEVYEAEDIKQVYEKVGNVLTQIGVSHGKDEDKKIIDEILNSGNQGTRNQYTYFKGIEDLDIKLQKIPVFEPTKTDFCSEESPESFQANVASKTAGNKRESNLEDAKLNRSNLAIQVFNDYQTEIALNKEDNLRQFYWPQKRLVSHVFLDLFEHAGVDSKEIRSLPYGPRYYKEIDGVLGSNNEILEADVKTRNITPPKGMHWICWQSGIFFDIISCDIIEETLNESGLTFLQNGTYMDFGCSTGRTIRTLWAAFPESTWIGIDPVGSSIEWAQQAFTELGFHQNSLWPPIKTLDDESIDGGCAQSVWSHFSEEAAMVWLDEVYRVVKPGGFMLITLNGYSEIIRQLRVLNSENLNYIKTEILEQAIEDLGKSGFYFKADLLSSSVIKDQTHWSHAYIARNWFNNLEKEGKWKVHYYCYSRWGHKQDICILKKQY